MKAPQVLALSGLYTIGLLGQSSGLPFGVIDTQPDDSQPLPASEALARITVPDGFSVSLFASEPNLHQPIAFDFDDRGRVWAVECFSYPEFTVKNADRVIILSDPNNDGEHDTRQVFWDQGDRLTGIQLGFDGVWLTAPPYLLFIPDRDHNDIPDGPPEIVLDGFTTKASHNFVNGLTWGPDGWMWGRHGILAESKVGPPGSPESDRTSLNCSIWRYHPTQKRFEVLAHGTTNPWGLDFDDHGQAFFSNNVIGHLWHLIPGARYKRMFGNDYNPFSYALIDACSDHLHWTGAKWQNARGGTEHDQLGGGHSHSGGMIYLGNNWPKEYRGSFFMNNIHGNRMLADTLHRENSGYFARCSGPFLKANDPWFRGVSVKYGPDGGVFVTDWNDLGECHDNDGSYRSSGRMYKIVYGNSPQTDPFNLRDLSDLQLAQNQLHENEWQVRHSRRILQERAVTKPISSSAHEFLSETLSSHSSIPRRLRALWTLWATEGIDSPQLLVLLKDEDEHIRHWAIRLEMERLKPSQQFIDSMTSRADTETSSLVRLTMASALQSLDLENRFLLAEKLVRFSKDAEDANIPMMLWYGIEPLVANNSAKGLKLMQASQIPLLRQSIARRVSSSTTAPTP
jgi:putative membrane-bound dehydrogenase-like protein